MAVTLQYGRETRRSWAGLLALICGIVSGPIGLAIQYFAVDSSLTESMKEFIGFDGPGIAVIGAFIFAAVTLKRALGRRDRLLACVGIACAIFWAVAIFGIDMYVIAHLSWAYNGGVRAIFLLAGAVAEFDVPLDGLPGVDADEDGAG